MKLARESLPGVALITGAAGAIGGAVALRLASDGARVALVDVDDEGLVRVAEQIGRDQAMPWLLDVADTAAVGPVIDEVEATFGPLSMLVNVAGAVQIAPLLELREPDWDRIMDVNLKGTFFVLQAVARRMVAEGVRGSIVNTSSVSGRSGRADCVHYAASKAAVISVTQSASLALAPHGIRVNAICPGLVPSQMWATIDRQRAELSGTPIGAALLEFTTRIPLGRPAEASEIADAVAFLVSDQSTYVTGQAINVCGGLEFD